MQNCQQKLEPYNLLILLKHLLAKVLSFQQDINIVVQSYKYMGFTMDLLYEALDFRKIYHLIRR